jgi:GGDEF domain-containing protein
MLRLSEILHAGTPSDTDQLLAAISPDDRPAVSAAIDAALGQGVDGEIEIEIQAVGALHSRRCAMTVAAVDQELERSGRSGQQFSLVFLDLDHFKAINDTLGHGAGDNALRETGEVIKASVRAIDIVGR